jgi:hypothetical protein
MAFTPRSRTALSKGEGTVHLTHRANGKDVEN